MTHYDDETLMRRVDGELTPQEGERIDAAALHDTDLADRLAGMRGLRTLARDGFALAPDPRDVALARLIGGAAPEPSPWSRLSQVLADAFTLRRAALWGGLAAATFVGGVLVGPRVNASKEAFVVAPGGRIADAGLVRILDRGLASEAPDAQGRAVALTYQDGDGRWCRTFSAGDAGVAGLACREDGRWAIRVLAPLAAPSGEVRTAGADIPAAILSAVDASLVGETMDATAEARARDGGWR